MTVVHKASRYAATLATLPFVSASFGQEVGEQAQGFREPPANVRPVDPESVQKQLTIPSQTPLPDLFDLLDAGTQIKPLTQPADPQEQVLTDGQLIEMRTALFDAFNKDIWFIRWGCIL